MWYCFNHQLTESVASCSNCGKPYCAQCLTLYSPVRRTICRQCLHLSHPYWQSQVGQNNSLKVAYGLGGALIIMFGLGWYMDGNLIGVVVVLLGIGYLFSAYAANARARQFQSFLRLEDYPKPRNQRPQPSDDTP